MSSFSESALEKKLSELSNSQQSVQTLSLWIIHHRKHASFIVRVWHRELKKVCGGGKVARGFIRGNSWGFVPLGFLVQVAGICGLLVY
ncbi:hypothetical protein QQF64_020375 [Cirrhinus molitorella]|uniref:CID domain-containing protein n=1 Tax=Cirrhinus molitorella TaxID=172907 RepID=A0ABR3LAG8_9TELE